MPIEILVALIAAGGTAFGSWLANRASRKSIKALDKQLNHRGVNHPRLGDQIDRIADGVDGVTERLVRIEDRTARVEERIVQLEQPTNVSFWPGV